MISSNRRCKANPIRNAVLRKYLLGWALDQTAGGGRTKLTRTGRKATKVSRGEYAIATALAMGNRSTLATAGPRVGAEQIEQEW
jgi:hypothetical protein